MLRQTIDDLYKIVFSTIAAVATWYVIHTARAPEPAPVAPTPITPAPAVPSHKPLLPWRGAEAHVGGDSAPDGTPVQINMPQDLRMHNTGGSDGAGLCVFTSINHAAIWQDVSVLKDFQHWMRSKPGGGYPEKVDRMIARKAQEAGVAPPQYLQVEGDDQEIIELACKTGRMPSCTYGFSPSGRYSGRRISHMISVVHADGKYVAVLDNNYPEELEWDTKAEFQSAYSSDGGWTVILLAPSPPPSPRNKK